MNRPARPQTPPGPRLRLDIGELHLHGFAAEHRERFSAALETALADLLDRRGPPSPPSGLAPATVEHLRCQASSADPESAAREAARAIWRRLEAAAKPRRRP